MASKQQRSSAGTIEVVLILPEKADPAATLARFRQAAKKAGFSPAFAMASPGGKAPQGSRGISWDRRQSEWAAFLGAADSSSASQVLLWPFGNLPRIPGFFGSLQGAGQV